MHMNFSPQSPIADLTNFENFLNLDIRVGSILEVKDFPEARKPSYILIIDFGDTIGSKKSSAQITINYSKEELIGKQVAAVVNFPPRQIGPIKSEVLVLGFADSEQNVVLFSPDKKVPNGSRLH
jgi:tRNA-binding protein